VVRFGCALARNRQLRRHRAPPRASAEAEASAPLIAEEARSHHFGAVISKPGLKLKHAYRLVNTSKGDIKVLELVNRRPCCGEVRIGKTLLHSGEETEVGVTLSIRQEFGEIVHDTAVLTKPASPEELVLRTMARIYPAIRTEVSPVVAVPRMIVMKAGQRNARVRLQARDQSAFRVVRVGCESDGMRGRAADGGAAVVHVVEVERQGAPSPGNGRGLLTVLTDHPGQPRVEVPIVAID
jgi:hypothetical protein